MSKQDEFPPIPYEKPNETGTHTTETPQTCGLSPHATSRRRCGFVVKSSSLALYTEAPRNQFLRTEVAGLLAQLPISNSLEEWLKTGGDTILVYELSLTELRMTSALRESFETLMDGLGNSTDQSKTRLEKDGTTSPNEE